MTPDPSNNAIDVYVDLESTPVLAGQAFFTRRKSGISTTFVYSAAYLASDGYPIDPELPLVSGAQHVSGLVRAFADGAPDRWGRNLIDKAERAAARQEHRPPRQLDSVDYLLGVSDRARQGALRFSESGTPEFYGHSGDTPKLIELPTLLHAADQVRGRGETVDAVKQLLDTGSTGLGGARPKASVRLDDGALAIAKFPHSSDQWDVMAWEALSLDVMARTRITVPTYRLVAVDARSILILTRFDRTADRARKGYISAMTGCRADDGQHRDYADIADSLLDLSESPRADLSQLFERVCVSVALGNTDDHLRNHGFLRGDAGWRLSPVFDVNPNPDLYASRSTSIMGADAFPEEVEALRDFALDVELDWPTARDILQRVVQAAQQWRVLAQRRGIRRSEQEMMAPTLEARIAALSELASA